MRKISNNKTIKRTLATVLTLIMLATMIPASNISANPVVLNSATGIMALPEAIFDVYGSKLDRGLLVAMMDSGVFISWRYFPEEATGFDDVNKRLTGANFAIYRNGVKIADVVNSTNFIDPAGTDTDTYVVVTVVNGYSVSRSKALTPAPRLTAGFTNNADNGAANAGYLAFPVHQPPDAVLPNNQIKGETVTATYFMDEMTAADVDGDGQIELVMKWQGMNPDVINAGYTTPVIFQCYKLDGSILWEIDMGINIRAGQHYSQPMLHDFDGDGKAEFMIRSAPGSKWRTFENGVYDDTVPYTFITIVDTPHTRWDGTKNWTHQDDYRSNDWTTTPAAEDGSIFQWMVSFFKNWQDHPEVRAAYYGPNLEYNYYEERGGFGWWKYPPQVMLGMYPAGYVGDYGTINAAGAYNTFAANAGWPGWTQEVWEILNAMPKDPVAFKSHVITDAEALALTHLFYRNKTPNVQRFTSGHIIDGPEFMTVFNGATGAEMDTIPLALPRGMVDPVTGKYYPDIGILWNDFTATAEPNNRVERSRGGVAYLDGPGMNPSNVQGRGYYSRTTFSRYDWDGTTLTGKVIADTGYEVLPNPFRNGSSNMGGAVAWSNTHGGPGRGEGPLAFNPADPRIEVRDENGKGRSATMQGQHMLSIMDVDGDGFDEIVNGGTVYNSDGSIRHVEYYWIPAANTTSPLIPGGEGNGRWVKIEHGNSMQAAFMHPDAVDPMIWMDVSEGNWARAILQNANTGEFVYISPGNANAQGTAWAAGNGNYGRTTAGKFTDEPGWQIFGNNNTRRNTPVGVMGGLRQYDGTISAYNPNLGTNSSINWRPNLTTQAITGQVDGIGISVNVALQDFNGTSLVNVLRTSNTLSHGGTKGQPALEMDIIGDYREELILGTTNAAGPEVRIYFNTEESTHKLATMMADRRYRVEVSRQWTVYNQPSFPGYYYGSDMNMAVYFDAIGAELEEPKWPLVNAELPIFDVFLPDPFEFYDGSKVENVPFGEAGPGGVSTDRLAAWAPRAEELKDLAAYYEFGYYPDPNNEIVTATWANQARSSMNVTVTRIDNGASISFTQAITYPNAATQAAIPGPYPVVIGTNAPGNAAALQNGGYATITLANGSFASDNRNRTGHYYTLYPYTEFDGGVFVGWAWGVSKVIDALEYLAAQDEILIDPEKVAVTGFSRWGKAAMVAGLYDERIGVVNPAGSGSGGAGVYRVAFDRIAYPWGFDANAEMIKDLQHRFPWWFNSAFNALTNGDADPAYLPFDHHELLAAIAPRGVFSSVGYNDVWLNAEGQWVAYKEAKAVYDWLGVSNNIAFMTYPAGHANFGATHVQHFISFMNHMFRPGPANTLTEPIEILPIPGGTGAMNTWTPAQLAAMPNWKQTGPWATTRPLSQAAPEVVGLMLTDAGVLDTQNYIIDVSAEDADGNGTSAVDFIRSFISDPLEAAAYDGTVAIPVTVKALNAGAQTVQASLFRNGAQVGEPINLVFDGPNYVGKFPAIDIKAEDTYHVTAHFLGAPNGVADAAVVNELTVLEFDAAWFDFRVGQVVGGSSANADPGNTLNSDNLAAFGFTGAIHYAIEFATCADCADVSKRDYIRVGHSDNPSVTINGQSAWPWIRDAQAPYKCCFTLMPGPFAPNTNPMDLRYVPLVEDRVNFPDTNVTNGTIRVGDPMHVVFDGITFPNYFPGMVFKFDSMNSINVEYPSTNQRISLHRQTPAHSQWITRWDRWNIDYVLDGGTNPPGAPATFRINDIDTSVNPAAPGITLPEPTKEGYLFGGWFTDPEFTQPFLGIPETQRANVTLYVWWALPVSYIRIADADGNPHPQMIPLSRNTTEQFYVIVNEGSMTKGVIWSTNNPNLATVDADGLVTIKGMAGNATLTARAPSGVTHSIVLRIT